MPKFSLLFIIFFLFFKNIDLRAQSAFVPNNTDIYHQIDRLEILSGKLSNNIFSGTKPFARKAIIEYLEKIDSTIDKKNLTNTDYENINYLKTDSWEWLKNKNDSVTFSKKKLWNTFFGRKADFYSMDQEDINLHISPIFCFSVGKDGSTSTWQNTRGIEIRGTISKKLGFYTMFTENQISLPEYVNAYHKQYNVIPGEGHWKPFEKAGFDFISARAYISFAPIKPLTITFGHDKAFIGSGLRSVFLSDFSAPLLFLKLNTKIGKVQYQNQFIQLRNYQNWQPGYSIIPKKYMVNHHLSININKKLNIGLIESVVLSRPDKIDFNYVNPIIFYRFVESFIGSPDNAMAGFNFRYLSPKKTSIFGQILFDELVIKDLFKNSNRFTNKWAFQLGIKAVDIGGIRNVDLQSEINATRPYTYSHFSSNTNFSHYNQALAHPLGANFKEWITVLRFQPSKKLLLVGTYMAAFNGLDRIDQNWGGNILMDYDSRVRNDGIYIGQGLKNSINFLEMRATFSIFHNLFADATLILRNSKNIKETNKNTIPALGLRWNLPYKQIAF